MDHARMKLLPTACLAILAANVAAILPATAQTSVFRTAQVEPGKVTRVATITALKRDCKLGELGEVKVVTAPKHGSLVVRSAKLKTPASFRCPNVETPVHGVFYQPNGGFSGTDEIGYETKTADGVVQRFNLRLEIGGKAAPEKKDLQEL